MAEAFTHPTAGRRRRDKGPPSMPTLPRLDRVSDTECEPSDDSAGEKEAKRQRSEPTTPVSTSGRLPYDYDAVMGITKVGTKEVEGFGEDLDTSEYHDAAEEPSRKDESDDTVEPQRLSDFQGGYGSSSLKECIELLTTTTRIAPAPLDSGDGQKAQLNYVSTLMMGCRCVLTFSFSQRPKTHENIVRCSDFLPLPVHFDKTAQIRFLLVLEKRGGVCKLRVGEKHPPHCPNTAPPLQSEPPAHPSNK